MLIFGDFSSWSKFLLPVMHLHHLLIDIPFQIIFINQTAIPMFDVGYFWDLFQEFSANEVILTTCLSLFANTSKIELITLLQSIGLSVDGGRSKSPVVSGGQTHHQIPFTFILFSACSILSCQVADIMLIDVKKFLSKRSTSSSVQPATRDIVSFFLVIAF